jgi:hypothetical protein
MTQEKQQKKVPNFKKKQESKEEQKEHVLHVHEKEEKLVEKENVQIEPQVLTDEHAEVTVIPKVEMLDAIPKVIQVSPGVLEPSSAILIEKRSSTNIAVINEQELIRDLMFNDYFIISENEAKQISLNMINHGFGTLNDVKWFLAQSERKDLSEHLIKKHCSK